MSDNIPPDLIERELEARFRIPNEVWTDVFKLLPRRVLVQIISPVCYRFKEIINKNVKNIHVIENADQFTDNLEEDDPEANQQLEHLAGSSCQLASQFRMTYLWIRDEKSQAILHHCPDLFNGCNVHLRIFDEDKSPRLFLKCLSHLEKAKPVAINVDQRADLVVNFWHHPTFQNCTRVRVDLLLWPSLDFETLMTAFPKIFNWLHHRQPREINSNDNAAADQQVRCMIIQPSGGEHIDWLLNRCSKNLQQSLGPTGRRPFVFSFAFWDPQEWTGFSRFRRVENKSTGEVLVLDRFLDADNGKPYYRLRRCLAEEEANGADFYAGMFKRDWGYEQFNIDEGPTVTVE